MVINKAVFFDRDGVLNRAIIKNKKPYSPRVFDKFILYKNIFSYIQKLIDGGFKIFLVTNQPDVGNKFMHLSELNKMHNYLSSLINFDEIFVCLHGQSENCICRKPSPYFIIKAKTKYNLNLKESYFIGDRYSDYQAANQAGCQFLFIDRNYKETPSFDFEKVFKHVNHGINFILKGK
ncbi:HAD-IIIA family hydrolase [bacterium]|nr:HAD-IIIA family hydrolase [bacterium]